MLTDGQGRHLNYLRVSVTDRCNLRCRYCMPHGMTGKLPHTEILSYEEHLALIRVALGLGLTKLRLTGGEPLARRGFLGFVRRLGALGGFEELLLTTNGVELAGQARRLKSAGISRVNISLDSLDPGRFAQITGRDHFSRVWEGFQEALEAGFSRVKLNCVVMRGVNDGEIPDFVRLTLTYGIDVRFIEYMPLGAGGLWDEALFMPAAQMLDLAARLGELGPVDSDSSGPAQLWRLAGAPGRVGFISPVSSHFCAKCNRLRLTADGKLRPCLLSDAELDLKTPLRAGAKDEELAELFIQAARLKPKRHALFQPGPGQAPPPGTVRAMNAIGG